MDTRGITFYIVAGLNYGGFGIRKDGPGIRLVLGWISICIMLMDIETSVGLLMEKVKRYENKE